MTLNITVLTETRIYQSSDFRLSSNGTPLPQPAMKLVSLGYPTFSGLVCYTGIAREGESSHNATTADHLVEWLKPTANMKLFRVVETIQRQATL